MNRNRFYTFILLTLSLHCFPIPAPSSQSQKFLETEFVNSLLKVGLHQSLGIEIVKEEDSIAEIQSPSLTTQSRELSRQPSPQEFLRLGTSAVPQNYPNFKDNPLLTDHMRFMIANYLIPVDHPVKATLDFIFSQSRVLESERTLIEAGFEILVPPLPSSYIIVARHPEISGYVFKLHLDSENRSRKQLPSWIWLVRRCAEAKKIRKTIQRKNIRYFSVPDKWIFVPPAYPYSTAENPQPIIIVETDMELVSQEETEYRWKKWIKPKHLDELYSIIKHGHGGMSVLYLVNNVPYTKNNKFAFIDTEGPQSKKVKFNFIKQYLSKEMQNYWDSLIQ